MKSATRYALPLMALTIFIDFTGFGLIIPLLPLYAERLGANAFSVGLILTVYSLAQFFFTPILGSLSDRYGRKSVILWSLFIEIISFCLTALANSFAFLLIARLIGGLGASNIGSAQAVVADVTTAEDRARGMGFIGAAIGLGFVVGPALGGLLSLKGTTIPFWVAAGLAALNALLVARFLPETRRRYMRNRHELRQSRAPRPLLPLANTAILRENPVILRLVIINFLFMLAFSGMEAVFALFAQARFHWGAEQTGLLFTYIGVIVVIMQGGVVAQLVKRFGARSILITGLFLLALGFLLMPLAHTVAILLLVMGLLSIGDGAATPTISTLLSLSATSGTQGAILGLSQGFGSLARLFGPLLAGALFQGISQGAPFLTGGSLVLIALLIALPAVVSAQPQVKRRLVA